MRASSFRWLFAGVLIVFVMVGVDGALNIYMYTYFWELDHTDIVSLAAAYPIGVMIGALVAPTLQADSARSSRDVRHVVLGDVADHPGGAARCSVGFPKTAAPFWCRC